MASTMTSPQGTRPLLATPMPADPAPLNLGSPRVRAAMRVLGMKSQDVVFKEKSEYPSEVAFETFERKRRLLIDQVHELARNSPEAVSITSMAERQEALRSAFLSEVMAIEKKNLREMHLIAKKDIEKTVITELQAKHTNMESQQKLKDAERHQREHKKERDQKIAEQQKIATKRQEKNADVRRRAIAEKQARAEEAEKALEQKIKQSEEKIRELGVAQSEKAKKSQEHRDQCLVRKEELEASLLSGREKVYGSILERDRSVQGRLDQLAQEQERRSGDFAEKLAACARRVDSTREKTQAKLEENFVATENRHAQASKYRSSVANASLKEMKTRHTKQRNAFESRYNRLVEEWEKPNVPKRLQRVQSMTEEGWKPEGVFGRPEYVQSAETHKAMVALCDHNRKMLKRAHSYAQERELERIAGVRSRVQAMVDSRFKAEQRRMDMIKNCAIERQHLSDEVDRVKVGRVPMSRLLATMEDPEPEAATTINGLLSAMNLDLLPGTKVDEDEK
eukprot:TRINITY_DN67243_c0_g1_i1.p1 TRINITY_DN67243_c0_g1~~TRINITY_DN67243_c0_g1_i1.p1  ORF type:complete len:524 (-),score=129.92 TRINITY_DN67243_c0_g1_i1:152-1678(-)